MYIIYFEGVGARNCASILKLNIRNQTIKKNEKQYYRGRTFFPPLIFRVATQSFLRCGLHGCCSRAVGCSVSPPLLGLPENVFR